jgi:hypothetical protein
MLAFFAQKDEEAAKRKVRRPPSWPRSCANSSLLWLCAHGDARANLHRLGQPDTFLATVMIGR